VAKCEGRIPGDNTWDESVAIRTGCGSKPNQHPDPVASNYRYKMGHNCKGLLMWVQRVMGGAFEMVLHDEWPAVAPFS